MSYLAVTNWQKHQHYKDRKPTWIKFYVALVDPHHPINQLPIPTRYLFDRLLLLAAEWNNSIPNDHELIAKLAGMPTGECREALDQLLKGRWIREKQTNRTASKRASKSLPPEAEAEAEKERSTAVGNVTKELTNLQALKPFTSILHNVNGERAHELERLAGALTGGDENSRDVLAAIGTKVPMNILADLRERAEDHRKRGASKGYGWAINALKSEKASA